MTVSYFTPYLLWSLAWLSKWQKIFAWKNLFFCYDLPSNWHRQVSAILTRRWFQRVMANLARNWRSKTSTVNLGMLSLHASGENGMRQNIFFFWRYDCLPDRSMTIKWIFIWHQVKINHLFNLPKDYYFQKNRTTFKKMLCLGDYVHH